MLPPGDPDCRNGNARRHPYLHGNFAPIDRTLPLTPCAHSGTIPAELAGGQYVRNGGNPATNADLGRDAHWFDGDGMLSGVSFARTCGKENIEPRFVNAYVLTDVLLSSVATPSLQTPILPSIATLVSPATSLLAIFLRIFRTVLLVVLSHLPGSRQAIRKISVANTSVLYHDGRALATCESGPPMRIALPGLETVGWFDGRRAEGEIDADPAEEVFGGDGGILGFMREWTTAHPRVDPDTNELILFHSTFVPPFVRYSVVAGTPRSPHRPEMPLGASMPDALLNSPVPGVSSPKMMHDFGVSLKHTVILDLPLSLDPLNLARNRPVVSYDPSGLARFGVFPRRRPQEVRWFETAACCIFHTANTWDEVSEGGETTAVNMLACRLTSASLVFSAGDIAVPVPVRSTVEKEEEQCRLYYHRFDLSLNVISHQWALSAIPFEFPSVRDDASMASARYIYGCASSSNFGAALGRAVKIDALVKMDALALIARGLRSPPTPVTGCVDMRSVDDVCASTDPTDAIRIFPLPQGWFAQEPRFVPRAQSQGEDDGWLLFYVFDEAQLDPRTGEAPRGAFSELWVLDARDMREVVARVRLPQRVPYGLHGAWFSEAQVATQRPVQSIRSLPEKASCGPKGDQDPGVLWSLWMGLRRWLLVDFLA
ncbi:MAG: hypothetical protein M1832_006076 [Thelocarpon impressellum]|nr:MAG: hypothetical protein M1832_006076 [Thelocarpon impressellum]